MRFKYTEIMAVPLPVGDNIWEKKEFYELCEPITLKGYVYKYAFLRADSRKIIISRHCSEWESDWEYVIKVGDVFPNPLPWNIEE
jgi:hypothetical protein